MQILALLQWKKGKNWADRAWGENTDKVEDLADGFNRFFQSVFTTDHGDEIGEFINSHATTEMEAVVISREGIFQLMLELEKKKGSGPDDLPTEFLKRYAEWVSFYLEILFVKSM